MSEDIGEGGVASEISEIAAEEGEEHGASVAGRTTSARRSAARRTRG